ncbi:hypothetical protein Pyn_04152 [Prunus yedoensis var. nudiflora]|uniref:Uncharacterized protein n=1 Tax=Prunus yedoensis var. nudiflora TaxID=2094558 RepID=A0A314UJY0_PRUYE|nr:hypothetical protein Pyn_04152 [Prunus yedoensis var. nudiflora]
MKGVQIHSSDEHGKQYALIPASLPLTASHQRDNSGANFMGALDPVNHSHMCPIRVHWHVRPAMWITGE